MNEQGSETWGGGYLYLSVLDTQKPMAGALFKNLGQSSSSGPSYIFCFTFISFFSKNTK